MTRDRLLTPLEAAEKLGLHDRKGSPSARLVLYHKDTAQIPALRIGGLVRFSDRALDEWIRQRARTKGGSLVALKSR